MKPPVISLDLNPPPPAKPKLPGWRTELRLEERRIELAAAAAAKAAADGAADGVVVNDDRVARWTPKQKGYYVYTFNVKEGEPVIEAGHDDACLVAHDHAGAHGSTEDGTGAAIACT